MTSATTAGQSDIRAPQKPPCTSPGMAPDALTGAALKSLNQSSNSAAVTGSVGGSVPRKASTTAGPPAPSDARKVPTRQALMFSSPATNGTGAEAYPAAS